MSNVSVKNRYESSYNQLWPLLPPKEQAGKKQGGDSGCSAPLSLSEIKAHWGIKKATINISWQNHSIYLWCRGVGVHLFLFGACALQRLARIISPKAEDYCGVEVVCVSSSISKVILLRFKSFFSLFWGIKSPTMIWLVCFCLLRRMTTRFRSELLVPAGGWRSWRRTCGSRSPLSSKVTAQPKAGWWNKGSSIHAGTQGDLSCSVKPEDSKKHLWGFKSSYFLYILNLQIY